MTRINTRMSAFLIMVIAMILTVAGGAGLVEFLTSPDSAAMAQTPPPANPPAPSPQQPPEKTPPPGQPEAGPQQPPSEAAIKGPKKKKKPEEEQSKQKMSQKPGDVARFTVNVALVRLDVVVTDGRGTPIPNLSIKNFRVYEDKVEQKIENFQPTEAPMTAVLLMEFSRATCGLMYNMCDYGSYNLNSDARVLADMFFRGLRPEDWVAVIAYDIKPEILTDFTQDKKNLNEALRRMNVPAWSEANLFDALSDTLDRLQEVDGKKAVLLFTTGLDTFSKSNFDKTLKKVQNADASIYAVSFGAAQRIRGEDRMGSIARMDFLQADNQLNAFAKETGGKAYFPRFEGEWPTILQDVMANLRSQYSIGYSPSTPPHDGKYHKVKVDLVAEDGGPLTVKDQHNKTVKVDLRYRPGYYAPKG
jgi:VWFA-related protein